MRLAAGAAPAGFGVGWLGWLAGLVGWGGWLGRLAGVAGWGGATAGAQAGRLARLARHTKSRAREIHLSRRPPSEGLQRHIPFRGEFHGSGLPLPEVLERPIRRSREIHLREPPLSEGLLGHIGFQGEFHGSRKPLPEVPLKQVGRSRPSQTRPLSSDKNAKDAVQARVNFYQGKAPIGVNLNQEMT